MQISFIFIEARIYKRIVRGLSRTTVCGWYALCNALYPDLVPKLTSTLQERHELCESTFDR